MAAEPKYKLYYFNVRALGELSRYLFRVADVPFVDERFPLDAKFAKPEWEAVKDSGKFPFNKIPILVVDGKHTIAQSAAIERYLAKQFGFFGKNDIEAARIDSIGEQLSDIAKAFFTYRDAPEDKKAALKVTFYKEQLPEFFRLFERWLKSEGTGHFVGDKLSLADIAAYVKLSRLDDQPAVAELFKSYPLLHALYNKLDAHPHVQKWHKERPQTFM